METPVDQGSGMRINGLKAAASKPDADPCDVACEAMPARVVGDLSDNDVSWLLEHTDDCNYCANELKRYDRLGEALTAVGAIDAETYDPPPVKLPRRDRVWYTRIDSPIGELILAATPEGLREIEFGSQVSESDFVTRQQERGLEPVRLERIENASPEVQGSSGMPRLSSMSISAVSVRGSTFRSTGAAWPPFNAPCSRRRYRCLSATSRRTRASRARSASRARRARLAMPSAETRSR
jgi:hypothetical protein